MNTNEEIGNILYDNSREPSVKNFFMAVYSWLKHNLTPSDDHEEQTISHYDQSMYPRYIVSDVNVCKCCKKLKSHNDQVTLMICNKD